MKVIIGEGFIGGMLARLIPDAIQTTRRPRVLDGRWPYDMTEGGSLPDVEVAFLCAGVNGSLSCARDPQGSYRTNVDGTVRVAEHYRGKAFLVWLSSTTVEWSSDDYGTQKRMAESILRQMPHVGIVRAGRVTTGNVRDLCRKMIEVGEAKIPGVHLWGEDEKPYEQTSHLKVA